MSDSNEYQWILLCLARIEQDLGWGSSADWNNFDFEKLSIEIETRTHTLLSVTTLKRLWGKIKYDHDPSLTTLNTLAQYLGHNDWRSFKLDQTKKNDTKQNETLVREEKTEIKPQEAIEITKESKNRRPLFIVLAAAFLMVIVALTMKEKPKTDSLKFNPDLYQFKADKILTTGVPNSVIFHYDATAADDHDSVFIVQTWDIRRKVLVSKDNHKHSAIYYFPGYFNAKLIIDTVVVKKHALQIATEGWLGLIDHDASGSGIPIYIDTKDMNKNGTQDVDETILKKYNIPLLPVSPKVRFFNQRDLGDLMNDNFSFETSIRNNHKQGDNTCQFVQVLIQCKDDIIIIPLSAKPCVGDINLYVAGLEINSKTNDLSGFGADLDQWTDLKVDCKDKTMTLYVNGNRAFQLTFPHKPTGIVGVQYRFNGVGAIRNTFFLNNTGKIIM